MIIDVNKLINKKICFLRISKVESRQAKEEGREPKQVIEDQLKAIEEKFSISFNDENIIKEQGSAYDIDKIHKRYGFLRLINILFAAETTTIKEIFVNNKVKRRIDLYVWDYDRFMRNMERSIIFQALNDLFDVTIYSYKDGKTLKRDDETPSEKVARYMLIAIRAYSAEQYSYTIAQNIKKTIRTEDQDKNKLVTYSSKGNVWGRKFVNLQGEKIDMSPEEATKIKNFIIAKIKYNRKRNKKGYGPKLKREIAKKYNIKISNSYLTERRKEACENK